MARLYRVCYHFFCAAVGALFVLHSVADDQSVTQILVKNGLPSGLLPATVTSYTLEANGKFSVNLQNACTAKFGPEEVYYKKTITGELSYETIKNLGGIQVHEWFWFSVTDIEIDKSAPDMIWFKIGYFSKSFSTDVFQIAPTCNSLAEEEEHKNAMTFSEWLSKALGGTLEVNVPRILDIGAARKILH